MSDFYLVFKNLTRNKLRLVLSCFAIFIAFLLFGVLGSVQKVFDSGEEASSDTRLMVVNKINFTQPLPIAYVNKIKAIEGVASVTYANWFGGYYKEQKNMVPSFAVDQDTYFEVYNNFVVDPAQLQEWQNTRTGLMVGRVTAEQWGWKVGDKISLSSNIFSQKTGGQTWEFNIVGIFDGENPQVDTSGALLHYKYFIETQTFGSDWVGWIPLNTTDVSLNDTVTKAIDEQFANSPAETKTSTEAQFAKAFIEQLGNIGFILTSVVSAAFFTILMIVANTMALAVSERTNEIAVLKTLGFSAKRIFGQVLSESLLLSVIGGLFGLGLAALLVTGASQAPSLKSFLPTLVFPAEILLKGFAYMLLLGFVTGFFPAYNAMKLNTIDALNRS